MYVRIGHMYSRCCADAGPTPTPQCCWSVFKFVCTQYTFAHMELTSLSTLHFGIRPLQHCQIQNQNRASESIWRHYQITRTISLDSTISHMNYCSDLVLRGFYFQLNILNKQQKFKGFFFPRFSLSL